WEAYDDDACYAPKEPAEMPPRDEVADTISRVARGALRQRVPNVWAAGELGGLLDTIAYTIAPDGYWE
ncbi:MAG: hypothetical protein LBE06_05535, partial [Azoarcus sp.]|nr:hypothetical protein [Azoarcus sp.]